MTKRILAIVVTYYPERDLLVENVGALIGHVDRVLIWENTPAPDREDYRFVEDERVTYYGDGINSISRALNYAWEYANEQGFDYLLTMDQDSRFENFGDYVARTVLAKDAPAGIWTPQMNEETVTEDYEEIDIPITSGMLAAVDIVNSIGGWNEMYTIASVDDEFFLQAHLRGIKKWKVKGAKLVHRLGNPRTVKVMGHELVLRNYSPERLHDIYRNNIILIRRYPKIDYLRNNFLNYWLKAIVLVMLFEEQRFRKTWCILKGIGSGLLRRLETGPEGEERRNLGIARLKGGTRVLVLMSTYNGELYLREQLDSILGQKGVEVDLLVRDDGSTDKTFDILKEYAAEHGNMVITRGENVGFVRSFSILAEMAVEKKGSEGGYDYYAFSDQDDIWMPNKLKTACWRLSKRGGEEEVPMLFSSNSLFVDDSMRVLGMFHKETPHYTKQNVMIYPTEQGCSMVFNRRALELYDEHPPKDAWHDRWMCLICNFLGKTVYCQSPLFYYRIHGGNMIGRKQKLWDRIVDDVKFFLTSDAKISQMAEEFYGAYENRLTDEDREEMRDFLHYKGSWRRKWRIMVRPEYQRASSWQERVRKGVLLMFNKI